MRRVILNPAFEQIRGKIATGQKLEYATKDNAAYEAPNGLQYARNYKPTVILQQRQASGRAYFSIRSKSATYLKPSTRRGMGLIGVTQVMYASLMQSQKDKLAEYFADYPTAPAKTPRAWYMQVVREMLVYRRSSCTIPYYGGMPSDLTWNNPYDLQQTSCPLIRKEVWSKFADLFAFNYEQGAQPGGYYFTVDGVQFFAPYTSDIPIDWATFIADTDNPNWAACKTNFSLSSRHVMYKGAKLYYNGTWLESEDNIISGRVYTTIAS